LVGSIVGLLDIKMSEASWFEVALIVDGEMAEAVAEVMARFIPDGVVIESTAVVAGSDGAEGQAVGPLRVSAYLLVNDELEETRRRLEEALWYLGRIRPLPPAQFRPIEQTDWTIAWKQHYQPIPIGRKLMIVPAWLEPPQKDRIPIYIDPGMAFGTGAHPSTQLCLELVEEILSNQRGSESLKVLEGVEVIDLGCGSGILSIAALKLGVGRALGVDIDEDALRAARQNAEKNGVAERLELGDGSLAEIRAGAFSLRQACLVLANILAPVIIRLLDDGLDGLLKRGGSLVLAGILEEQRAEVEASLEKHGLRLVERRQQEDWVALWAAI
jgi:ribosomal protein L11 methyltransferase